MDRLTGWIVLVAAMSFAVAAMAGGSNYAVASGSRQISGKVSEWSVPTPKYPRDPVAGPDGAIYFSERDGDRVARFDPTSQRFQEWVLRQGFKPSGLRVTMDGKVLFGGLGSGTIAELDPRSARIREFNTTSPTSRPYTLILDPDGSSVWFTERTTGNVVKLERPGGKITPYYVGGDPYGISIDARGNVWVSCMKADKLVRLDPRTGKIAEIGFTSGSFPRRTAIGPDGMLWVALYGAGKLARIDTVTTRVVKEYVVPGGPNSGPYAVNMDGSGRVWVSEIQTDSVDVFDPRAETFQVIRLPSKNSGIRKASIDAEGRYWYAASHIGKLAVIE